MNKIRFSKKERRIIIVLMIINCFALFVNYFEINNYFENTKTTPKKHSKSVEVHRYHFFTDRNEANRNHGTSNYSVGFFEVMDLGYWEKRRPTKNFYPFVSFTSSNIRESSPNIKSDLVRSYIKEDIYLGYDKFWKFRGIFPYYDYTEFAVYTILIFGIPIIRKLWN